ncbi:MAG: 2-C-methyl-D-erythritol 2,4-cyclodiphosphate synthase [Synergistaceae bacterium]|nr:2-C-methyl-D-erythritol 2,4-cyclodiphosphate synthase [Synergistaceae bacterium]
MTSSKNFSFIIAAAGKGSRMGAQKQFMKLSGRELWRWSAENAATLSNSGIREIILVIPENESLVPEWHSDIPLKVVNGGSERALSVLNGLNAAMCDYVMVHDAARPFATPELFKRLIDVASEDVGVVPVLPVSDALKRIEGDEVSCVERDGLYITQTPQVFPRKKLIEAVRNFPSAKDEAEAWFKLHLKLKRVEGERLNFKATVKEDIMIARALTETKITRTGLGWDIHRLVPERKLILGGVEIESPLGLLGHSDADVLTHAVMDSILGGAGLPDIGNIFPASDERFRGADSIELLKEVMRLVEAEGWEVEFVDAVLTAQIPRLNKYRDEIIKSMAEFFPFNIKFKSAEELDDSGKGLCMTCRAIATLGKVIESACV